MAPEIDLLLSLIDRAYDTKSWHGTNLKGSIRRIRADRARQRPGPGRKSIVDNVVHAAYWKYAVRRLLVSGERRAFPLKGSNWFDLPDRLSEAEWRSHVALLESQHQTLRLAVSEFDARRLGERPPTSKYTHAELIQGIASHDLYHAGQIQLIKRLCPDEE